MEQSRSGPMAGQTVLVTGASRGIGRAGGYSAVVY